MDDTFDKLLGIIFSYVEDLRPLTCVCTRWNRIATKELWKSIKIWKIKPTSTVAHTTFKLPPVGPIEVTCSNIAHAYNQLKKGTFHNGYIQEIEIRDDMNPLLIATSDGQFDLTGYFTWLLTALVHNAHNLRLLKYDVLTRRGTTPAYPDVVTSTVVAKTTVPIELTVYGEPAMKHFYENMALYRGRLKLLAVEISQQSLAPMGPLDVGKLDTLRLHIVGQLNGQSSDLGYVVGENCEPRKVYITDNLGPVGYSWVPPSTRSLVLADSAVNQAPYFSELILPNITELTLSAIDASSLTNLRFPSLRNVKIAANLRGKPELIDLNWNVTMMLAQSKLITTAHVELPWFESGIVPAANLQHLFVGIVRNHRHMRVEYPTPDEFAAELQEMKSIRSVTFEAKLVAALGTSTMISFVDAVHSCCNAAVIIEGIGTYHPTLSYSLSRLAI